MYQRMESSDYQLVSLEDSSQNDTMILLSEENFIRAEAQREIQSFFMPANKMVESIEYFNHNYFDTPKNMCNFASTLHSMRLQ